MFWFLHTFIIVICWLHCTYTTPHTHAYTSLPSFPISLSQSVVTHALVVPATHTVCSLSLPVSSVGLAAREATTCGAANGGARTGSRGCTESGAAAAEEHQWGNYLHRYNVHAAALCGSQSPVSIAAHEPQQQSHHNNNNSNKGVNNNHSKTTAATTTTTGAATTITLATFR